MKNLHPKIRKYWEDQGEEIIIVDNLSYTEYRLKRDDYNDKIPIANFSKLAKDKRHPDKYWLTKDMNEVSYSEEIVLKMINLKAFW